MAARAPLRHAQQFRYVEHRIDPVEGRLTGRWALDDTVFEESVTVPGAGDWGSAAVAEAARLWFLLAGVSYYKAAAPPVVDLGATPLRPGDLDLLRDFYVDGLGEYAYRLGLDLTGLRFDGGIEAGPAVGARLGAGRPLVPFGGGIDSIVTVEAVRSVHADTALFVMSHAGGRYEPLEAAAAVTGLPVRRAERRLDPKILRSSELGYLTGHVPITGILSSVGLLVAVLDGRDELVMSNEWSASSGNVAVDGREINHQYSKSDAFELGLRDWLARAYRHPPQYFSFLRQRSELWVARRFAALTGYHPVFRSCNRAFAVDRSRRLDTWCGVCDKCCFIDLILAPFMSAAELEGVFGGREPLRNEALEEQFRVLVGLSANPKPFECVGEVGECQAAAGLAAGRDDRAGDELLGRLAAAVAVRADDPGRYLVAMGPGSVPAAYALDDLLV